MNRTVKGAKHVHGKDPQLLVEKIIRERIFDSRYWKENCFGMNVEKLLEHGSALDHVGGVYANQRPTPFLCLVLRMLQIQPEEEIVDEFITQEDFKYLRVLGLFYRRLVGTPSISVYRGLEPYMRDQRKIRLRLRDGTFSLTHVDEIVDELLRVERSFDIILPRLTSRMVLEETEDLEERPVLLSDFEEDDLLQLAPAPVVQEAEEEPAEFKAGAGDDLSIEETNKLRAQLGLKPLSL